RTRSLDQGVFVLSELPQRPRTHRRLWRSIQRSRRRSVRFKPWRLMVALGGCLLRLIRMFSGSRASRAWARAAAAGGALTCAAFIGVALTPENRLMALHIQCTFMALRCLM